MAMTMASGVWHPGPLFPLQELNKPNFLNWHYPKNFFHSVPNAFQNKTDFRPLSRASPEKSEGRSVVFHWDTLDESRSGGSGGVGARGDDGVVLLVGLFNLLAVVVYVGHQLLTGALSNTNKRIVLWQVQKVLDELVLRVHSSDTASNLLSRALKSSTESISGREIKGNAISTFIFQSLNEKDPHRLQNMLNQTIDRLQKEIASSPQSLRGAQIDPVIYKPIKSLYWRLTEPYRQGRAFSSSLLQEMSAVTKVVSGMNLKEVQNVLNTIIRLGRMHQHYDIVAALKSMIPTRVVKGYGVETTYDLSENDLQRLRRDTHRQKVLRKRTRQRSNSRYPRFSKSALQYKALKMKKRSEMKAKAKVTEESVQEEDQLSKRKGTVENVSQEDLVTNWADGWFTLLTQASPVALDISTLYTRSVNEPHCLRSFLCKANGYWRRRGTFQATLSPFFSVLASWALEDMTPYSLGDSLIAVRAGWMGKTCSELFPACQQEDAPNQLVREALKIFDNARENTEMKSIASTFLSKSGEYELNEPNLEGEKQVPLQVQSPSPPSSTTSTKLPSDSTSSPGAQHPSTDENRPYKESHPEYPEKFKPYNRYDQPISRDDSLLPSGSITGMALQDRPLERMDVGFKDASEDEASFHESASIKNHRVAGWNTDRDIRGPQASPTSNDILPHSGTGPSDFHMPYIPKHIPSTEKHKDDGPPFLHQPDYSYYMALQQPAFIRQGHRSIAGLNQLNQPNFHSTPLRNDSFSHRPPIRPLKYKYGLRRGLPSRNVDGLTPLFETSTDKVPRPLKLESTKYKQRKQSTEFGNHHERDANTNPIITNAKRTSEEHLLERKHTTQFTYKDAITDPLRNDLLYQYIRDRHLSTTK